MRLRPEAIVRAIDAPHTQADETAWQTLADAVIAPVLGGGSSVVVEAEPDSDTLARIGASENVRH